MVEKETLNKVGIGLGIGGAAGVAAPALLKFEGTRTFAVGILPALG